MRQRSLSLNNLFWRVITYIWTLVAIFLFIIDFFSQNHYNSAAGAIGTIYIAILGIYVGTKEFARWQGRHQSIYYGEIFVGLWTVVMIILSAWACFSRGSYQIPHEMITVYITVLGIFALTQRSKVLYRHKRK